MANQSYLFYDLETTGLDVSFDQVIQFAAILTDQNLEEIERYNFLIRLNPDTIPSAYAQITHQIPIEKANTEGISEYDAMVKIHQLMNRPNTINLGYNTLGFDDEFLRFSFYRNLLDPYTHQYKDGCMRMDIYPMCIMYYLHDSNRLKWPKNSEGHTSFKLEDLNKENNLVSHGRAHDAITDVEVTLALAKILKENQSMWQYLENLFVKVNDQRQLDKITDTISINENHYKKVLLTNGKFGARNQYQSQGLLLGQHNIYKNQYCFLRLDLDNFQQSAEQFLEKQNQGEESQLIITDDFIENLAYPCVNKKLGETPFLLPLLERFTERLSKKSIENADNNAKLLKNNIQLFNKLKTNILNYTHPTFENIDPQSALYVNGFLKPFEKNQCNLFHQKSLSDKANMLSTFNGNLQKLAIRVIGRVNPNLLNAQQLELFQQYLESVCDYEPSNRRINFQGKCAKGLNDVYNEIRKIQENNDLSEYEKTLLDELETYLNI